MKQNFGVPLSRNEMKNVKGGTVNPPSNCTTDLDCQLRTGDPHSCCWNSYGHQPETGTNLPGNCAPCN